MTSWTRLRDQFLGLAATPDAIQPGEGIEQLQKIRALAGETFWRDSSGGRIPHIGIDVSEFPAPVDGMGRNTELEILKWSGFWSSIVVSASTYGFQSTSNEFRGIPTPLGGKTVATGHGCFVSVSDPSAWRLSAQNEAALCDWLAGLKPVSECKSTALLEPMRAKKYLISKDDICEALGQQTEKWDWIKRTSKVTNGPIISTQGRTQPVEYNDLMTWWNGLKDYWRGKAAEQRETDELLSANVGKSAQYLHGTENAVVVPEIAGSVKRRRADRK